MLLLSHRLRAEPVDKISVYVVMDAPDPVLGKAQSCYWICAALRLQGQQQGFPDLAFRLSSRTCVTDLNNRFFLPSPHPGEDPAAVPEGAPAGVAVRLCGAAELASALQLMQARLHPELAQVTCGGMPDTAWQHYIQQSSVSCTIKKAESRRASGSTAVQQVVSSRQRSLQRSLINCLLTARLCVMCRLKQQWRRCGRSKPTMHIRQSGPLFR